MFCVIIKYDPVYINIYRCFALRGNPFSIIYIIKQDIRICIYMLRIADQTAIWADFIVHTHGWPGGVIG